MPQKYKKLGVLMPGFKQSPEEAARIKQMLDEQAERIRAWELKRKFKAEPEELKILDAIASLPEQDRGPAAEGALIARMYRRLGRPK